MDVDVLYGSTTTPLKPTSSRTLIQCIKSTQQNVDKCNGTSSMPSPNTKIGCQLYFYLVDNPPASPKILLRQRNDPRLPPPQVCKNVQLRTSGSVQSWMLYKFQHSLNKVAKVEIRASLTFSFQSGWFLVTLTECISQFHSDLGFDLAVNYSIVIAVFARITLVFASFADMLFSMRIVMELPGNFPYASMFQIWMIGCGFGLFFRKPLVGDVSCSCFYSTTPKPYPILKGHKSFFSPPYFNML